MERIPATKIKNVRVSQHSNSNILSITIFNNHGQQCVANFDLMDVEDIKNVRELFGALREYVSVDPNGPYSRSEYHQTQLT
jgi:hypothetical protein